MHRKRSPSAEKQRAYRQRQRERLAVYSVPAGDDVLAALLKLGLLTSDQALDRRLVEQALAAVLAEWGHRWR